MTDENKLFPGRPNYTGPTKGWFGLLHHSLLYEESHDVMERVEYVKKHKPKNEVAVRLHNMIYIDHAVCDAPAKHDALYADYEAKRDALYADYKAKCVPLYADYKAKCVPLGADYKAKCVPLYADYEAKRDALYADYEAKCAPLDADYEAKRAPLDAEILAYIKKHIPDCAWNGEELDF